MVKSESNLRVSWRVLISKNNWLKLGEDSRLEMADDADDGLHALKLVRGKIDIGIERVEIFEKKLDLKIRAYEVDLKTTRDEVKQRIVDQYRTRKARFINFMKKLEVRTPSAVTSDRNTRFVLRIDDLERTEVIVFEGSVEVRPVNASTSYVVEAGYKALFSAVGIVSGPEKTDPSKPEMR